MKDSKRPFFFTTPLHPELEVGRHSLETAYIPTWRENCAKVTIVQLDRLLLLLCDCDPPLKASWYISDRRTRSKLDGDAVLEPTECEISCARQTSDPKSGTWLYQSGTIATQTETRIQQIRLYALTWILLNTSITAILLSSRYGRVRNNIPRYFCLFSLTLLNLLTSHFSVLYSYAFIKKSKSDLPVLPKF